MLRVGLIGLGFMGRGHLDVYLRLAEEGYPVKLVAICDVDPKKFKNEFLPGNLNVGTSTYDFSGYNLYADYAEMLANEELDYVDIALPTYLHRESTVAALESGCHVLCEKPMALSGEECQQMIDAAQSHGRTLMIAQCLRFWPEYEVLKDYVDNGQFGKVTGACFFRGGGTPRWSYQNWLLQKEKSGGALLDQHVHDVDTINWLFGKPEAVSAIGRNVIPGSGYDIVSTHYLYEQGPLVNAQDDWTLNGDFGFQMTFRVSFEHGNLVYERGKLQINPHEGSSFSPEVPAENGYYREIRYFAEALANCTAVEKAPPASTRDSIVIAEAEIASADQGGALVRL